MDEFEMVFVTSSNIDAIGYRDVMLQMKMEFPKFQLV
ncbi:MAG: hypothetical protein FD143_2998 [Ignavibacteria bacterium]|nr:MAG: hypothetical protein FD143_2998 [Ignavibacteria bacterium]KAF0155152.1 MAG: hypothetical protein FD188_3187 [Ignavibacteria bacterium]